MRKQGFFILILALLFVGERPAAAWENIVIETSEDSAQTSLDRIAGPDHRGFSSRNQSYESDSPTAASPGGISF